MSVAANALSSSTTSSSSIANTSPLYIASRTSTILCAIYWLDGGGILKGGAGVVVSRGYSALLSSCSVVPSDGMERHDKV